MSIYFGYILDGILVLLFLSILIYASKKGLIMMAFGFLSWIASIVIGIFIAKPLGNYFNDLFVRECTLSFFREKVPETIKPEAVANLIDIIPDSVWKIAEFLKINLVEVANEAVLMKEGVTEAIVRTLTDNSSVVASYVLGFLASFAISGILLFVVRIILNIISKLPIINLINSIGGVILGAILGFLACFFASRAFVYFGALLNPDMELSPDKTYVLNWLLQISLWK